MKAEIQHKLHRCFKVDKSMFNTCSWKKLTSAVYFHICIFSWAKEALWLFTSLQTASGFRVNDAKETVFKMKSIYQNYFPLCEINRKTISNVFGFSSVIYWWVHKFDMYWDTFVKDLTHQGKKNQGVFQRTSNKSINI